MTPSLMPTGPDAWHMLDPASMSVVIVIVLYCTVLYCTVLHSAAPQCVVSFRALLYRTVPYCTVLSFTVVYCAVGVLLCRVTNCIVLLCTVLYSAVSYFLYCIVRSSLLTKHTNTPPTDQHNGHILTDVFSISVLVSVFTVSQCPCLLFVF